MFASERKNRTGIEVTWSVRIVHLFIFLCMKNKAHKTLIDRPWKRGSKKKMAGDKNPSNHSVTKSNLAWNLF